MKRIDRILAELDSESGRIVRERRFNNIGYGRVT
jgi:hypothetical protein